MRAHINHQVLWGDFQIKLALHVRDDGCFKDHPYQYQPLSWWQMLVSWILVGFHRSVIFHQTYQPRNQVMFASARPRANNSTIITILTSRMNLHPQAGGFPFCPACQVRVSRFWQDILETRTQSHAHTHQVDKSFTWFTCHLPSPSRHYQLVASL